MSSSRWWRAATLWVIWTIPPAALTIGLFARQNPPPVPWTQFFAFQLLQWWPWALLTPLLGHLRRRWPLLAEKPKGGLLAAFFVHGATASWLGFALTSVQAMAELARAGRVGPPAEIVTMVWQAGRGILIFQIVIYGLVLGALEALALYRRNREREELLTRARLQALQFQLQPHFLFNTLHAVSSLIDEDPAAAKRMIARLSELLRAGLDSEQPIVPLRREIETARRYLEIEEVRFEDRLRVLWDVDPEILDTGVPHLMLQPLLENAIRHGVSQRVEAGRLEIRARCDADAVEILVEDDGPGPEDLTEGIGLANTRARLTALYGDAATFVLQPRPPRGARAVVRLPYIPFQETNHE